MANRTTFRTIALLWASLLALPTYASSAAAAPLSLTAEVKAGFVLLSWSPATSPSEAAGYRVYRSLSPGGPYTLVCGVDGGAPRSCRDAAVANNTTYYYIVKAVDSGYHEGLSSNEASVIADTAPPSAFLWADMHGMHFSGKGPVMLEGKAVDAASGIAWVKLAIRRNDTKEWWSGEAWTGAGGPVYLNSKLEVNGTAKWHFDTTGVQWSQATSYYIRVAVRDRAGFEINPADSTTMFLDTPAILALSVAAAPGTVTTGQFVNVTVLVANTGGTEANSISVLPPRAEGSSTVTLAGEARASRVQSLAPGEFVTMNWNYAVMSAGELEFRAEAGGSDAVSGAALESVRTLSNGVHVRNPAKLSVNISPLPANIRQGSPVQVRMLVSNAGGSDAIVSELAVRSTPDSSLTGLAGPEPALPYPIKAGETREFQWRATAAGTGEIKLTGVAYGHDEMSGKSAVSAPHTSGMVGVASSPVSLNMSSSAESVIVRSRVELSARVKDSAGIPVPGVAVSFRAISGGGSVQPGLVVTDEFGRAETVLTTGSGAGINAVEGRVGALLGAVTVEGVAPGGEGQYLSRSFFDPSREPLEIRAPMETAGRIVVTVRNAAGEPVVVVADRRISGGQAVFRWDGRNSAGAPVPNGVYFIFIQSDRGTVSRRVSVLAR